MRLREIFEGSDDDALAYFMKRNDAAAKKSDKFGKDMKKKSQNNKVSEPDLDHEASDETSADWEAYGKARKAGKLGKHHND